MTSLVPARSRRSAMIFWSAVGIRDALRDPLDARLSQASPDAGRPGGNVTGADGTRAGIAVPGQGTGARRWNAQRPVSATLRTGAVSGPWHSARPAAGACSSLIGLS